MISLVCGDPEQGPASYTRFVLPFRYRPEKWLPGAGDGPAFQEEKSVPGQQWRERYLTDETADVLFRRARWFALKENGRDWKLEGVCMEFREGEAIPVSMATPWLVLFEWPNARGTKTPADPYHDILLTGFLVVELQFPEAKNGRPDLDDLLKLNQLFRYWQRPYDGHEVGYRSFLGPWPVDPRNPRLIRDTGNDGDTMTRIYLDRWAGFLELPVKDGDGVTWRLFPKDWSDEARAWAKESSSCETGKTGWITYADNRTFVWTCAIVDEGEGCLRREFGLPSGKPWEFGHWVKLLNVDLPAGDPQATHKEIMRFERDWAKDRTYQRWEEGGTFYGFNYHAGAMLGPPRKEPPLWRHFGQMYFDQVLLLLYLRVSLFRFSAALNTISSEARGQEMARGKEKWREEFQKLRWEFALFTNLYQFPLLSNQQQGIEMYSLARKFMDVQELFHEVKEEIESSHDFLAVEEAHDMTKTTTRLTAVATFGLGLGIATGLLGMNILVEAIRDGRIIKESEWLLLVVAVGVGLVLVIVAFILAGPIIRCLNRISGHVERHRR